MQPQQQQHQQSISSSVVPFEGSRSGTASPSKPRTPAGGNEGGTAAGAAAGAGGSGILKPTTPTTPAAPLDGSPASPSGKHLHHHMSSGGSVSSNSLSNSNASLTRGGTSHSRNAFDLNASLDSLFATNMMSTAFDNPDKKLTPAERLRMLEAAGPYEESKRREQLRNDAFNLIAKVNRGKLQADTVHSSRLIPTQGVPNLPASNAKMRKFSTKEYAFMNLQSAPPAQSLIRSCSDVYVGPIPKRLNSGTRNPALLSQSVTLTDGNGAAHTSTSTGTGIGTGTGSSAGEMHHPASMRKSFAMGESAASGGSALSGEYGFSSSMAGGNGNGNGTGSMSKKFPLSSPLAHSQSFFGPEESFFTSVPFGSSGVQHSTSLFYGSSEHAQSSSTSIANRIATAAAAPPPSGDRIITAANLSLLIGSGSSKNPSQGTSPTHLMSPAAQIASSMLSPKHGPILQSSPKHGTNNNNSNTGTGTGTGTGTDATSTSIAGSAAARGTGLTAGSAFTAGSAAALSLRSGAPSFTHMGNSNGSNISGSSSSSSVGAGLMGGPTLLPPLPAAAASAAGHSKSSSASGGAGGSGGTGSDQNFSAKTSALLRYNSSSGMTQRSKKQQAAHDKAEAERHKLRTTLLKYM
jgi:hypothetical protein